MAKNKGRARLDKHVLYEAAVQNVEESVAFMHRVFQETRGKKAVTLREDFCGTGAISCAWAAENPKARALGLDLDEATLMWGERHNRSLMGTSAKRRVTLLKQDVRSVTDPVDIICAFNFSYYIFKQRNMLVEYLACVHRSLNDGGMFVCDLFGGTEAMSTVVEKRKIDARKRPDGISVPAFTYYWEHSHFNAITHELLCYIHFKLSGQPKRKKVFEYDWRLWTIPEMLEIFKEAGFSHTDVYLHGWDEDGESDNEYKKTTVYENAEGWLAYLVAQK